MAIFSSLLINIGDHQISCFQMQELKDLPPSPAPPQYYWKQNPKISMEQSNPILSYEMPKITIRTSSAWLPEKIIVPSILLTLVWPFFFINICEKYFYSILCLTYFNWFLLLLSRCVRVLCIFLFFLSIRFNVIYAFYKTLLKCLFKTQYI